MGPDPVVDPGKPQDTNLFIADHANPNSNQDPEGTQEQPAQGLAGTSPAGESDDPRFVHASTCVGDKACSKYVVEKKRLEAMGQKNSKEKAVVQVGLVAPSKQVSVHEVNKSELVPGYDVLPGGEKYGLFTPEGSGDNVQVQTLDPNHEIVAACFKLKGCAPGVIEESEGAFGFLAKAAQGVAKGLGGDLSCAVSPTVQCIAPAQPAGAISGRTATGPVAETKKAVGDFNKLLVPGRVYKVRLEPGEGFVILKNKTTGEKTVYTNVNAATYDFGPNGTISFTVLEIESKESR